MDEGEGKWWAIAMMVMMFSFASCEAVTQWAERAYPECTADSA